MSPRALRLFVYLLLVLGSFAATVSAQTIPTTFPSYVVDAQIPITASDGFNNPQGLAVAPDGTVYVADAGNHRVLQFSATGVQTTVNFGSLSPALDSPTGIALDGGGSLYVTDRPTNRLIKLPKGAKHGITIMAAPVLNQPISVASDTAGNLAIANAGNGAIIARRAGGTPFVFNTGSTVLISPQAVAFDNQGILYVADNGNPSISVSPAVYRFPKFGGNGTDLTPTGYFLKGVTGLTLDQARNLYVLIGANEEFDELFEIPISGAEPFQIPQSNFVSPTGLAIDSLGNLYVADNSELRNSVTKFVYHNAAEFGSLAVGALSSSITFNFAFYETTTVKATQGVGGGAVGREYHQTGGNCANKTFEPTTSALGLTQPAMCTVSFNFQPALVGGRPGAVQLVTSNGTEGQLVHGTGLGAQLALMNASVKTKLTSFAISSVLLNAADTEIYFDSAGGIYKMPVAGDVPTLIVPNMRGLFAVNGAGDLFVFNSPTVTKIPADGSANTVITIPGLINPQSIVMDYNGAMYVSDLGPAPTALDENLAGYVVRVSPTGIASKFLPGTFIQPSLMTADNDGNIYVGDPAVRLVLRIQVGTGSLTVTDTGPTISGANGQYPRNLAADQSHTVYFWDDDDFGRGLMYFPPSGQTTPGFPNYLPLYTVPGIFDPNFGYLPFIGSGPMAISPSGKMYIGNGLDPGLLLVDRTLGTIPVEAFDPNFHTFIGGKTQPAYVYNIGNQDAVFIDPAHIFTESGSGVGSFTFGVPSTFPCEPGSVIVPGNYCSFTVTNTNFPGTGLVTDTLHFLTNAVNPNSAVFQLHGVSTPAPQ